MSRVGPGPISTVRREELSKQRYQNILQRKIVVYLDPACTGARVIGGGQSGSDATALFYQVNFRTRSEFNPATNETFPNARDWDQFTMAAPRKEGPSRGIESNTWKAKVE